MERKYKKDFRLYLDSLQVVKEMTKEEAGEFILACIAYWEEEEIEISRFCKLAFSNTKAQFDRDFESYKSVCVRNAENWKTGWRPKTHNNPENPSGYEKTQSNPEKPHTDTHTDTDTHTQTDSDTLVISSKEDKEQALVLQETFWNNEINLMQKFLRQAVWVTQFKDSKERWYVTHCYNLMTKIGKEEFQYRLKTILKDEFKSKNCNKLSYLYWELKAFIHSPVVETEQKWKSKIW